LKHFQEWLASGGWPTAVRLGLPGRKTSTPRLSMTRTVYYFISLIITTDWVERALTTPKTAVLSPECDECDVDYQLLDGDQDIERASRSLKAMSHPLRLKILCTLNDKEVSVQDIVDQVGTSQSNISQHLAILRDKGILTARKDANRVYYKVGDQRTLQLIGMMRQVFCSRH
jgi:ArsR family transcriptional regulator